MGSDSLGGYQMKLVGIVGSNAPHSHNRLLLQYIAYRFSHLFDLEILEIVDVPLFNQSQDQTGNPVIQNLNRKIEQADGVIISTPEHNHTITSALKSTIEWLSFNLHPFDGKPTMIMGASYYQQGSSRAQLHLRQILDAPGVNAMVLPGNEFLLGNCKDAFDQVGQLKAEGTVAFLETCLRNFLAYVELIQGIEARKSVADTEELVEADATASASASWEVAAEPVPVVSTSKDSFEQALDQTFGLDLGIAPKEDVFDTIPLPK